MKNNEFYRLLHRERDSHNRPVWTTERLARSIYSGRSHVSQVLGNKPKRGIRTRWKLAQLFRQQFPQWEAMMLALGWEEQIAKLKEPHAKGARGAKVP